MMRSQVRGPGAAGSPDGPAGCGDAAGGHRQRNLTAPLDLPLWARTIKRAVRHERLLAIKACRRGSPRFRLIFEINTVSVRVAAVCALRQAMSDYAAWRGASHLRDAAACWYQSWPCAGALRDAGEWGYEGHLSGPVRLDASGLGHVAAMRIRGRRGGLFAVVDLAGMVMGSWDTPVAGLGWLKAGAIGQFGLAIAAVAVLIAGAARPSWHRGAAITAYAIIALEIGWFLLTRMLVQDHP